VSSIGVDSEEAKHDKREGSEDEAEELVGGAMPGDVNDGPAGREWDGDEAVVALNKSGDEFAIARDTPGRVVAEIED
jgi:hypothetical protein